MLRWPTPTELAWRLVRLVCVAAIASGFSLVAHACDGPDERPEPVPTRPPARVVEHRRHPVDLAAEPVPVTMPVTMPVTPTAPGPVAPVSVTAGVVTPPSTGPIVPAPAPTPSVTPPAPASAVTPTRGERVAWYALAQVGKPYVFGADGPTSFDCSGLTRTALATVGVDVPHYAAWQAGLGRPVAPDDVRPGDLVFTSGGRPRHDLGHVGVAVSATEWVQAPAPGQRVRRGPIPLGRVQAVRRFVGA